MRGSSAKVTPPAAEANGTGFDVYLARRLSLLEARVHHLVASRRELDAFPDDQFRGLYVSDEDVDRLLTGSRPLPEHDEILVELDAATHKVDDEECAGPLRSRLFAMAGSFGLHPLDVSLLVAALAPDIDSRYERLYGYLNDDVTRRRATVGLALELSGASALDAYGRGRLLGEAPLLSGGLLLIEDTDRPFLTRSLRVPDRVAAHLLGDTRSDPAVAMLEEPAIALDLPGVAELAAALETGAELVYLRDRSGSATRSAVAAAFSRSGIGTLSITFERLDPSADPVEIAALASREARLSGKGLLAGPIEAIEKAGHQAVRAFAEQPCPVVLFGKMPWDPSWSRRVPYLMDSPEMPEDLRDQLLEAGLEAVGDAGALDPAHLLGQFRLSPEQLLRAIESARAHSLAAGRQVSPEDVQAGARSQNAAGLEHLARRIVPEVGWEDLVLPRSVVGQLRELSSRARHRHAVIDGWGMRRGGGRGRGVVALFAGESGTGKTMSAEVIAGDLGIELYTVNLATVVDKYIGETEKNLERIFAQADGINGVLLFDEADALFGKRSEVSDAHDRYANIEVAYLLQRIESFDGLAILATNLRANVDEAFTRRLDAVVDFPVPEEEERLALWEVCLPPGLPRHEDIDLAFMARSFKLAGGAIRNITLTAAYFAAERGGPVTMADLVIATQREYRKLGRLCLEAEFGPYYRLASELGGDDPAPEEAPGPRGGRGQRRAAS